MMLPVNAMPVIKPKLQHKKNDLSSYLKDIMAVKSRLWKSIYPLKFPFLHSHSSKNSSTSKCLFAISKLFPQV